MQILKLDAFSISDTSNQYSVAKSKDIEVILYGENCDQSLNLDPTIKKYYWKLDSTGKREYTVFQDPVSSTTGLPERPKPHSEYYTCNLGPANKLPKM